MSYTPALVPAVSERYFILLNNYEYDAHVVRYFEGVDSIYLKIPLADDVSALVDDWSGIGMALPPDYYLNRSEYIILMVDQSDKGEIERLQTRLQALSRFSRPIHIMPHNDGRSESGLNLLGIKTLVNGNPSFSQVPVIVHKPIASDLTQFAMRLRDIVGQGVVVAMPVAAAAASAPASVSDLATCNDGIEEVFALRAKMFLPAEKTVSFGVDEQSGPSERGSVSFFNVLGCGSSSVSPPSPRSP